MALLKSSVATERHGTVTIVLNSDEEWPEWRAIVKRAERTLPAILKRERAFRRAAIPAVRRLRDSYFPWDHWQGSDTRLLEAMTLQQINFTDSGNIEMSYSGGEPCHSLTVRLTLGARFGLRGIKFDG